MSRASEIVERVDSLPPLPDTALKLMNTINDPRSSIEDIVETIRYDQAVTAQVLRLCNSAYFGLSRRVASLSDAMLCLGTSKVLQLVMSVYTSSVLEREQSGYGLDPGVLWKNSVAVALAASALAERLKLPSASLVFTAGLLHDIGKVVLNEHVAAEFREIVRLVSDEKMSFTEAEQRVLGFSHEEVGGLITEKWKLPEEIVRCVRFHHAPGRLDPPDPYVDAVYLGDCICLLLGVGLGDDGLYYRADHDVMARHGLLEQDLETVALRVLTDIKRAEQVFADSGAQDRRRTVSRPAGA